ncbi:transglycosylase SLT domain-containing protein [Streptomyces sp. G1]|uniref:transglycosylase SLT domain-containing protein n=1 Tax=Streptomyces sp. G1 TaxID=361572 RepID=UPI00202F8224|nr:transglycosylase SLT domain-containing protein [Streptomyces sp. G1]MCM1967792.1 transglycosylase SLT domain-containing protein [Streptomyces sp. G1]
MATRGRAPVKVGSGYIDIYPELSKAGVARFRADLAGIASFAAKQAKVAGKATEREAVDTSNKLRQVERSLTRFHGEEAGRQFRTYRNLAKQREALEANTSSATKRAISDVVRANRMAVQEAIREERTKASEQARLQREAAAETRRRVAAERTEERALAREVIQVKREVAAAARQAAAEQTAAERGVQAAARQRAAEERLAIQTRRNALQNELRDLAVQRSEYAGAIAANGRALRGFMAEHRGGTRSAGEQWKSLSQTTETFGTNLEQVGRALTQNLVAPLAAAAGYMTKIGTTSADMQFLASEGLGRAGFDDKQVMKGIKSIQDFAVHTPFSLEDMTDKFQQIARNFESYGNSTSDSLKKSELMIRGIADYAASFGVLDPERVKAAMYSADMMMDMSKLNTRSLKQFSRGTGIPINELAKIAGFEGAGPFLKEVQNPKGGVMSKDFFDKFLKAYEHNGNVKGTAEKLGTGSIGGALQSVKEQAQLNLGKQFGQFNTETGKFEWTELGKNVHALISRLGKLLDDPDFQHLTGGLMGQFVRALGLLLTGVEKTEAFLNDHPWLKDLVEKAVKVAAVLGPLAIAIGLATKIVGKLGKAFLPAIQVAGGLAKGVRGAARIGNQALAGVTAGRGNYLSTYRERRAEYHDGDTRSMVRRGVDQVRGQDSRAEALQINTQAAEQALRDVDQKIQTVKAAIRSLNELRLANLADSLGGEAGTSVKASARDAEQRVSGARQGVQQLNQVGLGEVTGKVRSFSDAASAAEQQVKQAHQAVRDLNDSRLGMIRQQFEYLKDKADTSKRHTGAVGEEINKVNSRSLDQIRGRFGSGLTPAIKESKSAAADLNTKIKDVNGRGLGQVTTRVRSLRDALDQAADKAGTLEGKITVINGLTGAGGGGDASKKKGNKHALGGIVPGYAPGVDNYPAILSPGEAILRPEVAHALGANTINGWNAAAARGRLSRHAKGTAGKGTSKTGAWPMSILEELYDVLNIGPGISAFTGGIDLAAAGARIGGPTGSGVRRWGAHVGGDSSGRLVNDRFGRMKDFVLQRIPSFLTKAPTGIGNLIGIAAGGIAPTAGQLFWDDVWKGEGTILQRGTRFTADLVTSLPQILKDLVKNIWDSGAEILGALKDAITNPKAFFEGALSSVASMFEGMVDQVRETARLLTAIFANPDEYASEVFDAFLERVNELMPNTKGLFAFADGGIVPGYAPGTDSVPAMLSPGEAVLRPEAARFLGYAAIQQLNAGAKNGSLSGQAQDAQAVGLALPDVKAFEGAASRITAALGDIEAAQRQLRAVTDAAWQAIGSTVASTVDGQVLPAIRRQVAFVSGPLSQADREYQATHQSVWSNVQSTASSGTAGTLDSFTRLRSGLSGLSSHFQQSGQTIQSHWRSAMSYVESSTRSTLSGPYNRGAVPMLSEMAKLAGTGAPLRTLAFAHGGVVPGYAPGVDSVPAVLSPGEGILRPEVVRALGAETILRWNDQARKTGNLYANGGIVGPVSFNGASGGDWVAKHKDDDFDGYTSAFKAGWKAVVEPMLGTVQNAFGLPGDLAQQGFARGRPWLEKWTSWVDEHTSGGGAVVKVALDEWRREAPMVGGSKYTAGVTEAWCADFVSWVVDHAGANAAYGGSPKGTPANRWPAVATWNAAMRQVPVAQSQPGDLLTYQGNGHINIKTGPDETVGGNESNSLKRSRGYWRTATAALRPTGGSASADGPVLNAWPGSIPKFTGTLGGGVDSAMGQYIAKAMSLTGVSGPQWSNGLATIVRRESGGNVRAVNNWDSNARAGTPSKGPAQLIEPTFRAYHQPGTSWDIFDPVANLAAAINYIRARYGDISRVQQADPTKPPKGYWTGTSYASQGLALVGERGPELVDFRGGERVYNNRETGDLIGPRYEIHIHEAKHEDTTQAVIRGLKYVETMYGM